ncbi:MAG: hypothetical protein K6F09_04090 [Clostridiales bacterium]|nr:hypothetical protein [Clostridiales bacterium]
MKKITAAALVLTIFFAVSSCAGERGSGETTEAVTEAAETFSLSEEMSIADEAAEKLSDGADVEEINAGIDALSSGINSFVEADRMCDNFEKIFDIVEKYKGKEKPNIELLKNKWTGFYTVYAGMCENRDETAKKVNEIIDKTDIKSAGAAFSDGKKVDGEFIIDPETLYSAIDLMGEKKAKFEELQRNDPYFTAGKTYDDFYSAISDAKTQLDDAREYYSETKIDTHEEYAAFKEYFTAALKDLQDFLSAQAETLDNLKRLNERINKLSAREIKL